MHRLLNVSMHHGGVIQDSGCKINAASQQMNPIARPNFSRAKCSALSSKLSRSLQCSNAYAMRYRNGFNAVFTYRSTSTITCAASTVVDAPPKILSEAKSDEAGISIVATQSASDGFSVHITSTGDRPHLLLHWAINEWELPPSSCWPANTVQAGDKAVQTPLGATNSVTINFPEDQCPPRIVFVLKDGEKWTNNGGGDFQVYLKPPGVDEIIQKVIAAETEFERWSLFSRFLLAGELLDAAIAAGPTGMALMLVWLRYSNLRLLSWYKGTNYQSKDAAHVQKTLAQRMTGVAGNAEDPLNRFFARCCMSTLPRGGGNGDDIRMGILNVMREHGIREGHRPGIQDDFLESWHQKLHTNTTPEDVTICEAYLAFLHTNDMGEFWRVAWENGRLTPETLANMDHPVKPTPCHLPQLIGSMKHYLWILKTTHAGADLDVAFEMTRGHLDGDLAWAIGDILANREEWWVPGKIMEARRRLEGYWRNTHASRDILLLDVALDNFFRLRIERMDKSNLSGDDLINLIGLVLDNAVIAGESEGLSAASALWHRVADDGVPRWSGQEWASLALAATENTSLCLEEYADTIVSLVQPHAEKLGTAAGIESTWILNFGEEVVRSQPVFILSPLLRALGPMLREAAGVGAWQIVSQGPGVASGSVLVMDDLEGIQGKPPAQASVIVVGTLTGNEDIPANVTAVLTASATDVLSHVAIRARAQNVLLASCFDEAQLDAMRALSGESVEVGVDAAGDVGAVVVDASSLEGSSASSGTASSAKSKSKVKLAGKAAASSSTSPWVLSEPEFTSGSVGGKALNLAGLRGKLPDNIGMPSSIALPFGTFERVVGTSINAGVAAALAAAEKELAAAKADSGVPPALKKLRALVRTELVAPPELVAAVSSAAESSGLIVPGAWTKSGGTDDDAWQHAWAAICKVWASKWNDRAWLSRQANGIDDSELYMSVLVQEIIPAKYAFVLHTADPITGDPDRMMGELVIGMGEALVGNFPGRALSFSVDGKKKGKNAPHLRAFPSKRDALYATPSSSGGGDATALLIARSDSNGEDLEDFAGAGLYSSVPLVPFKKSVVRYDSEALMWDQGTRNDLLSKLAEVGEALEKVCGSPQDVEGVVNEHGEIFVVQTRPQVL